jgi:hypothetical protein
MFLLDVTLSKLSLGYVSSFAKGMLIEQTHGGVRSSWEGTPQFKKEKSRTGRDRALNVTLIGG